jgi:hypothetical protein
MQYKKDGAAGSPRLSGLSTGFMMYPFKSYNSARRPVPCTNRFLRWDAPSERRQCRSAVKSLLTSQSTISDETAEAGATMEEEVISNLVIYDMDARAVIKNNVVTVGNAENVLIKINGDRGIDSQYNGKKAVMGVDVPVPTLNGGYAHTSSSKAKISAANKGKVPWNKGTPRTDEARARIAEGVRRRNRERFLALLAEENISEEEYLERKKAERRKKDAERRTRRTVNGGYTPTEETKQKISQVLKEKYATGEVKRAPRDPAKVRRGFRHSDETKEKIRESLKRKWAEDVEYRELMTNKTIASGAVASSVRRRIAETLKKKWEDPEFRAGMLDKFANRRESSRSRNSSHRQRISVAMKKKWMDEEYRKRAVEGMARGRESASVGNIVKIVMPLQPKTPTKKAASLVENAAHTRIVMPLQPKSPTKKAAFTVETAAHTNDATGGGSSRGGGIVGVLGGSSSVKPRIALVKTTTSAPSSSSTTETVSKGALATKQKGKRSIVNGSAVKSVIPIPSLVPIAPTATSTDEPLMLEEQGLEPEAQHSTHHLEGCISQLREERRDLYDLLYGDEDKENGVTVESSNILSSRPVVGTSSKTIAAMFADDEDLDDFDPYGLHDNI